MAEKKTTKKVAETKKAAAPKKKNTAKKSTEIVDSASQMIPDEVGLTNQEVAEPEFEVKAETEDIQNPSTDAIMQSPDDVELVFEQKKEIEPKESAVEAEKCELPPVTDDHDAEVCTPEQNQEVESPAAMFTEDVDMVNDITNILNGIDGVKAKKLDGEAKKEEEKKEEVEKKAGTSPKNMTNTEEKNFYSEQFSRSWGGVMYDY